MAGAAQKAVLTITSDSADAGTVSVSIEFDPPAVMRRGTVVAQAAAAALDGIFAAAKVSAGVEVVRAPGVKHAAE